jgi:putative addiction module component (TIGR02574 family)
MSDDAEHIYRKALKLTEDERILLAARLFKGVEAERDPDYEEAWAAEIARRIDELDNGTAVPNSWDEVKRRIHEVRYGE